MKYDDVSKKGKYDNEGFANYVADMLDAKITKIIRTSSTGQFAAMSIGDPGQKKHKQVINILTNEFGEPTLTPGMKDPTVHQSFAPTGGHIWIVGPFRIKVSPYLSGSAVLSVLIHRK